MQPRRAWPYLLALYLMALLVVAAGGGPAIVVAVCLLVGWYLGYLHGAGVLLK